MSCMRRYFSLPKSISRSVVPLVENRQRVIITRGTRGSCGVMVAVVEMGCGGGVCWMSHMRRTVFQCPSACGESSARNHHEGQLWRDGGGGRDGGVGGGVCWMSRMIQ
jgi:hypothetical protein